jgi:hypothetical protein
VLAGHYCQDATRVERFFFFRGFCFEQYNLVFKITNKYVLIMDSIKKTLPILQNFGQI